MRNIVDITLTIPQNFSAEGVAWLWQHPTLDTFVCGILCDQITLKIDDLRLFKAIINETNMIIYDSCGRTGRQVSPHVIDDFIARYQPEEPNNKTTT